MKRHLLHATCFLALVSAAHADPARVFSFDSAAAAAGVTRVADGAMYPADSGYGYEAVPGAATSPAAKKPFYFSARLPEGNYKVTARFAPGSSATIRAELRRLMIEKSPAADGKPAVCTFLVNIRRAVIEGSRKVHLKAREAENEAWNWDDKLTLEFNGADPHLTDLRIEPVVVPTVFLIGDSTVCDQHGEPWNSWGQMLPRFFLPEVAVANHAESGESIAGSLHAERFEKIFRQMRKGDYLFVQFGHNDQKSKAPDALAKYTADLHQVVQRTKSLGGTPVLVTSMERKGGIEKDTLGGYPDAVRGVAREEQCALVELHDMSRTLYKALGAEVGRAFQDGTHHNNFGSYEMAKCVTLGIRRAKLPLAASLDPVTAAFDPAHPDAPSAWNVPAGLVKSGDKPLGN